MTKDQEEDLERVRKAVDELGEHFDTIQIFATRDDGGEIGTVSCNLGSGNWFARLGQVAEWLTMQKERASEKVRRENDE
jgi:hypothetical protein